MLFSEALDNLTKNKYAQRADWVKTGEYIVLMPGMNNVWKILTQPQPNAGNWLPLVADLLANDWTIIDKVAEPAAAAPQAPAQAA